MTFFEEEMRKLLEEDKILTMKVFCDKFVIGKLNDDINVKISFENFGMGNTYYGLLVEVINKIKGPIDKQTFRFSHILDKNPRISVEPSKTSWIQGMTEYEQNQVMRIIYNYISLYST